MQSYQTTFLPNAQGKGGQTNMILSPNNEYLKEFTGR
jgi:membrane protease subunit HflC